MYIKIIEKKCCYCKFFQLYYVKLHGKLIPADGNCSFEKLSVSERNNNRNNGGCEYWEPFEIQKQERREQIEGIICEIRANLAEIELILEDDNLQL